MVALGLRCSTPAMLVSTCCIDTRAGGTIPGALGGHLVIRPTARGAHLLVVGRSLLLVLLVARGRTFTLAVNGTFVDGVNLSLVRRGWLAHFTCFMYVLF